MHVIAAPLVAFVILTAAPAGAQKAADAVRGAEVFAAKQCARCHRPANQPRVGPPLERLRRPQGGYEFAGGLWNHVPAMFTVLHQEGLTWPTIDADEMAALMAFLGADAARDPAPAPRRGQLTLVAKGCLKCHSYRGEGARVAPDLDTFRADYATPAKWAATIWRHTPGMAAVALSRGISHPRFSDDEMAQLVGFLKGGR